MKKKFKLLILLLPLYFVQTAVSAQCAMCRASVENNVSNGDTSVGAGLNSGILYLFVMPYLMAMVIGFFWWKSAKKKKAKLVR